MELWERAAELDLLEDLLRKSARRGAVALVAGEAGIGKSVLISEFIRRCGSRARILLGRCDPFVTPRPSGPLHDIAAQAKGRTAELMSSGAPQDEVRMALMDELSGPRQRPRPVIVVEDAHWADEATLGWLAFMGRRVDRIQALLIISYRDDELAADHLLRGVLAGLPSAVIQRIPMVPLSRPCVREQAERVGHDPDAVYRLTGGNPLLVTELLDSGERVTPPAVNDLILNRLRTLPEQARDIAQMVAVIPTRAGVKLLADSWDEVDSCVDAGVLIADEDGVGYRHELLRRAVEDSLPPGRRAALNQRVLELLVKAAEGGRGRIDPSQLVHFARQAGDTVAILRYGQAAGADAAKHGAHREAVAHYEATLAVADGLSDTQLAGLWEMFGHEAYLAGLVDRSFTARRTALSLRERLEEPDKIGDNLRWIGHLEFMRGNRELAIKTAIESVKRFESGPPSRQLVMAYDLLGGAHGTGYEMAEAVFWGERARSLAVELGDQYLELSATVNVNSARLADSDRSAETGLAVAHERADALGFVEVAAAALCNLAGALGEELGDCAAALPVAEHAVEYTTAHELDGWLGNALGIRAFIRFAGGDWDAALNDIECAKSLPDQAAWSRAVRLTTQGRILSARGSDGALTVLDEASQLVEHFPLPQLVAPIAVARSEHFLWRGDLIRARDEACRGLEICADARQPFTIGALIHQAWRTGGTAMKLADMAAPYQLMIRGEWTAAADEWTRRGNRYLSTLALSGGDAPAAMVALRCYEGMGAASIIRRLRAELRDRGVPHLTRGPRRTTTANAFALTPREVEVLAVLAEGLSNPEIAGHFSLSVKTIERHVSAILAKLGVANRAQAIGAAHKMRYSSFPTGSASTIR